MSLELALKLAALNQAETVRTAEFTWSGTSTYCGDPLKLALAARSYKSADYSRSVPA